MYSRHVDAHHGVLVVEQERPAPWSARSCRHRWGRGTGTSRSAGSGPAGRHARGARRRDRLHRFGLADDALGQSRLPCAAASRARLPASCRPERPSSARPRAIVAGRHGLLDHRSVALAGGFGLGQLLLRSGMRPIGKLTGLGEVTLALGLLKLVRPRRAVP
jgi:hypothetical protein